MRSSWLTLLESTLGLEGEDGETGGADGATRREVTLDLEVEPG